jgi:two-component system response regulator BaeR
MVTASILMIDREMATVDTALPVLRREGYAVDHALPSAAALDRLHAACPDLIILGMGSSNGDWEFCRQVVAAVDRPLLLLLSIDDEQQRVKGLDLGADDCMGKPVRLVEMLARVHALLRRGRPGPVQPQRLIGL